MLDLQRRTSERFELAAHANKCDFYAAALEHRQSREHDAMARLRRCIPQQLELGHLNFLAQELNYSPDMTVAALREPWPTGVMAGLVDAIALHWNSLPLLRRLLEISPEIAQEALAASARHRPPEDVAVLTRRAHRHSSPAVRRMARAIEAEHGLLDGIQESLFPELTARENEILSLIAGGFRNAEIADRLFLSPATVKTHINRVFSKLGVGDRVRATLHYRERLKTTSETERIVRTRATDPKT